MTGEVARRLSPEALRRVEAAVARAEAGTTAEIVVMITARAGAYRSVLLVLAILAGLALPWPLLALTHWSAQVIFLAQAGLIALILAAGLHERLRLALVPRGLRQARTRDAAHLAFLSRGLSRTRARTGLLLFVSFAEHHAEIVADTGILARIPAQEWNGILADLLTALGRDETESGLVAAVQRMGVRLASEFPSAAGDPDELPNHVIIAD